MRFYTGAHHPDWLAWLGIPLCVSDRRLRDGQWRTIPAPAEDDWILDSGAFSEVSKRGAEAFDWDDPGRHRAQAVRYARRITSYRQAIGRLQWAASQDLMCEPDMLRRTGLSIYTHMDRSVTSYIELKNAEADAPIIPTVQGWLPEHYRWCRARFAQRGIDLTTLPVVGLGSVCRRAHSKPIVDLVREFTAEGLRLHLFGAKTHASVTLLSEGVDVDSADSMAWSFAGRHLPGCTGSHQSEANCVRYALIWTRQLLRRRVDLGDVGAAGQLAALDGRVTRMVDGGVIAPLNSSRV